MAEYVDKDAALKAVSWDTEAYTAVNMLPTADIRENVHGEWIHPYEYGLAMPEHTCSICGYEEDADTESKFCPNCGSLMDVRYGKE